MSDRDEVPGGDDEFARALIASSRAERPVDGARGRAFDVVVHELGATVTTTAAAAPTRRGPRSALAFATMILAAGLVVGGLALKRRADEASALAERVAEVRDQAEAREQALRSELANSKDPEKIAALQAQLAEANRSAEVSKAATRAAAGAGSGSPVPPAASRVDGYQTKPRAACNCTPGDPLCSCL